MSDKVFHLGDLLSVTTGLLVSPSHMDGVHGLIEFMAGEPIWTHQLPRVGDECKSALLEQFPFLADVVCPEEFRDEAHVWQWLAALVDVHGAEFEVKPLSSLDHTSINPLDEFAMRAPGVQVIPVVIDEEGS